MPKVSTTRATITEKDQTFEIHYQGQSSSRRLRDQDLGFSIKGLPKQFVTLCIGTYKFQGFSTEAELLEELAKAIEFYKSTVKKERKVIAFKITACDELIYQDEDPGSTFRSRGKRIPGISDKIYCAGGGQEIDLTIDWNIYLEIDTGEKQYFSIDDEDGIKYRTDIAHGSTVIPWTKEAENCFIDLRVAMIKTLVKLSEFFHGEIPVEKRIAGRAQLQLPETI